MKRIFVLGLLLLLTASVLPAADDPGAQYVDAFLLVQEGDAAKGKSDWKTAYTKFSAAQNILLDIKAKAATWNPHLVQFRLDYCTEQIDAIKPNITPTAPGLSATFVAPPKRTQGAAEALETQQLRTDLADALKQIDALKRQLEDAKKTTPTPNPSAAELDKLRAELAQARTEVERSKAAQLNAQSELNKKDAELATRLADMNQKLADLQKQVADRSRKLEDQDKLQAEIAKATTKADELKKQNDQLTAQLAKARTEADRAAMLTAQVDDLQKNSASLRDQLTEAKRLVATGSGDLQKLRTELLDTRAEAERVRTAADRASKQSAAQLDQIKKENETLAAQLTDAKRLSTGTAAAAAELQALRNELTASRAETERTRTGSASQIDALRRERQDLAVRLAAAESHVSVSASGTNKGVVYTKHATVSVIDEELQQQNRDLAAQLSTASRQMEKLRKQLATDARANAVRVHKINDELSTLKEQNHDLALQLASAKHAAGTADGNRGVLYRASSSAPRTESTERLEKENDRLAAQLADARRQVLALNRQLVAKSTPPAVAAPSVETVKADLQQQMSRLREENILLRQLLNRYAPYQPELKREAQGRGIAITPRKP